MALDILPLRAIQSEENENTGIESPKETPAEQLLQERLTSSVLRANAEQARRIADCARTTLETLLMHLDQPYAVVDRNETVTHWNNSLAEYTGIGAAQAVGQNLQTLLCLPSTHPLAGELDVLNPAITYKSQTLTTRVLTGPLSLRSGIIAAQITLVPLCRVPGSLEAMILLFCPA